MTELENNSDEEALYALRIFHAPHLLTARAGLCQRSAGPMAATAMACP